MPITEEKLNKLNNKANEFRKYTGIILNVNDILDDIEDAQKKNSYYDAFLFAYKNALNKIVPAMMGRLKDGQELPHGIGTYLNDIMNDVFSATASKEEKRIDTITRDLKKSSMYGHILEEHYDKMVAEVFQNHNHVLGTVPEYKNVAKLSGNEWNEEYTIRKTLIDATFTTAKHDVTWGELTEEDFHKMIKTLSEPYMVIREKYNQYNWFQKWILGKGTEERYYMNHVKDELKAISDKLGFKCDIKDELHKEGSKLQEVAPEKQALLRKAFFDMKNPIKVKNVVDNKPQAIKPEPVKEKAEKVEKNLFEMDDEELDSIDLATQKKPEPAKPKVEKVEKNLFEMNDEELEKINLATQKKPVSAKPKLDKVEKSLFEMDDEELEKINLATQKKPEPAKPKLDKVEKNLFEMDDEELDGINLATQKKPEPAKPKLEKVEKNIFEMDVEVDVNDKVLFDIEDVGPIENKINEKEQKASQVEDEKENIWDL